VSVGLLFLLPLTVLILNYEGVLQEEEKHKKAIMMKMTVTISSNGCEEDD
jgi:hypothetical protein